MEESRERAQSRLFVPMSEDIEDYRLRPIARIIYGNTFELTIVALILMNAAVLAVLTLPNIAPETLSLLTRLDTFIYALFVVEILLRIISFGRKPWLFFASRWNIFDFLVIALVPLSSGTAILLRLLKLLRIIRLFRFMPEFQMLSLALGRTVKPLISAFLLISLFMFLYGMAGVYLFGESDPDLWGDIGISLITLTILLTLENFPDVLEAGLASTPLAWVYFVSFMVIVVFTVLNLLIGIVLNAMDETRKDASEEDLSEQAVDLAIKKLTVSAQNKTLSDKQFQSLRQILDHKSV